MPYRYWNLLRMKKNLEDHPILREYKDVFPEEVPGLPPRRDIDFSIELTPGVVPASRTPYRMSMLSWLSSSYN
jgi:hypothetical protein